MLEILDLFAPILIIVVIFVVWELIKWVWELIKGDPGCFFFCLILLAVILGFFAHVPHWLATTCRIIVYLFVILILIEIIGMKIEKKKESKELARIEREREEIRARLEREKREKFATLKKELIESGLFYEDDPWDKLPDADNYRG